MTNELTQKFKEAHDLINNSSHIILATSENHDEDALGAMLGFVHYFKKIGKEFSIHIIKEPSPTFSFLPGFDALTNQTLHYKQPDVLIAFDHGDFARLKLDDVDMTKCKVISLDHHPHKNPKEGIPIIDTSFSSTAEMVYYYFVTNNISINDEIAACLYAGIIYDTGGFYQSNTSSRVMEASAKLIAYNFNAEQMYKKVLGFRSYELAKLTGIALKRMMLDKESKTAYSYISYKDIEKMPSVLWSDTNVIVELMKTINSDDIKCVLLFKEKEEEMITLSLRSDSKWRFNVQKLASIFNGGGHTFASGARIEASLQEAIESVLIEIKAGNFRVK